MFYFILSLKPLVYLQRWRVTLAVWDPELNGWLRSDALMAAVSGTSHMYEGCCVQDIDVAAQLVDLGHAVYVDSVSSVTTPDSRADQVNSEAAAR